MPAVTPRAQQPTRSPHTTGRTDGDTVGRTGGGATGRTGTEARRALLARRLGWTLAALAALVLAAALSLALGSRPLAPTQVWDALLHGGSTPQAEVVRDMRLPRTLVGALVGAALAVAGVVMQGLTRNPIAEPGILGVSQGASVGVVLAIAFAGVHGTDDYMWFAITGAGLASVAVYAVAARGRGGATPVKLALSGAAVNALLAAVIAAVLTTRAAALDEYRFWQVGSLSGRDAEVATQTWPFVLLGLLLVALVARGLDALALGEDMARGLGQRIAAVRVLGGLGATVLTGAGVAAAGPIAFVGLAVPHVARALVGTDHRWLLPVATLLGPVMLLLADTAGRLVVPPGEVPAGVMTALLGVPFLVVLVRGKAVAA